jgi:amino acid adenylation domain-containing protein
MCCFMLLQDLVINSASVNPDAVAVYGADETITYSALNILANRIAYALSAFGVQAGDRVALWLDKSARAIAAMQGILRLGAVYVPIDPLSPALRARSIMLDCQVKALITTRPRAEELLTGELANTVCLCTEGAWQGLNWDNLRMFSSEPFPTPKITEHSMAYILYTSGSTGKPKGVCISHLNALAFIEWAARELNATAADRFSNHAPFHFDLSVLDIYAAFMVGASVSLIPEGISYIPKRLCDFIMQERITIWYSVPSALILMMEHGDMLEMADFPVRALLFAGEPFPIKYLRRLRDRWPQLRLLNLYGPTETNVCTYYEVSEIPSERNTPVPIGRASCGDRVWSVKPDGSEANIGEEGELFVSGPTVMLGYWGQSSQGNKSYATGDIVRLQEDGHYVYIGRRDHMVKVRGHRIELGDIEAALVEHPQIQEAGVVVTGTGMEARLVAFLIMAGESKLSLLEVKRHCAKRLPRYMIVDEVQFLPAPPRTSTGKFDRKKLLDIVIAGKDG